MNRQVWLVLLAVKLVIAVAAIGLLQRSALGQANESTVIRGMVVSETGEPVQNARVDISTAAPVSGPAVFCPSCYLDCQKWTTTDEAGHFELVDLDPRLNFRLVVSAAGYKTAHTKLIAPAEKLTKLTIRDRPKTVDYQRTVRGVIKNTNGVAVQGALVDPVATINEAGRRSWAAEGVDCAVTDAKGYFEMDLVEGVFGIDIEVAADGLCSRMFLDLKPQNEVKAFELFEGAHVVGRVERRGRPVSGITISVAQTEHGSKGEKFFLQAIPTVTDSLGRFELKNIFPGQEYCVYSVVGEANRASSAAIVKTQKFIAPSSGETLDIGILNTVQPVAISGKLVHDGADAIGDTVLVFGRHPAWDMIQVPVAADGSFHIAGLPPEVYEIGLRFDQFDLDADKIDSLLWSKKSLKKVIDKSIDDFLLPICASKSEAPDIEPNGKQTLRGRVLDMEGRSVAKISVDASKSVEALGNGLGKGKAPWTDTDSEGQFTLAELPDTRVWLRLLRPDPDGMTFRYLGMMKPKLNASGLTVRLGPETNYPIDTLSGQLK